MHISDICRIFASEKENNNNLDLAATAIRHKVMTKQEFTNRVKVEVSNSEFDVINEFYMSCECDKDEFCKMWCKMNPNRVKAAKTEKMMKAREEAYRNALHKFYNKTANKDSWVSICYVGMTVYEIQAMSYAGIKLENECGSGLKTLFDVRYEIGKYLEMF